MGCCLIVLRCYFLSEVVMNLSFKVVWQNIFWLKLVSPVIQKISVQ
jgi:hypothetical protein